MLSSPLSSKLADMPSYRPPRAIKRLPFELLRSQQYPRNPPAVAAAAQEYVDGDQLPAWYVPQRAGFTRWKTPPYRVAWGQNVVSAFTALEQEQALLLRVRQANYQPPVTSAHQAAVNLGAERLPQPSDNEDPSLVHDEYPIARNALPINRVSMTGGELSAFIAEREDSMSKIRGDAHDKRSRALLEAQGQVAKVDDLLAEGRIRNNPWWSR